VGQHRQWPGRPGGDRRRRPGRAVQRVRHGARGRAAAVLARRDAAVRHLDRAAAVGDRHHHDRRAVAGGVRMVGARADGPRARRRRRGGRRDRARRGSAVRGERRTGRLRRGPPAEPFWPAGSGDLRCRAWLSRRRRDGRAGVAVRVLHAGLLPAERVRRAAAARCHADVGLIVTLPAEATGSAAGRGRLAGRRVLVVGAGPRPSPEPDPPVGNGRAISVLAAREGAAVACADRDAGAAEVTAALVRGEGQIAAVVLADVASPGACSSVVAESAAALGGLDGLVLNVGLGLGRGVAGGTAGQWGGPFAVNARAHFLVAAAALPVLDAGSAIVFISSAASLRAATGIPAYDASKAALAALCRQVAREGMARGIRANLVVPSLVDTPLGREASRRNPGRTARSLPFGRQATAWEVAYATVWLLSGESSYVNAHPLVLDGGATSFV